MNQRLTRKDIKRDEFTAAVGRSVEYAGSHVRTIVLAIGRPSCSWRSGSGSLLSKSRNVKANDALAGAMKVYQAPVTATGAKPTDPDEPSFATDAARRARAKELFSKVHDDYGSTDAGDVAGLYLGPDRRRRGGPRRGPQALDRLRRRPQGTMLAAEAQLNLLALDRKQGKGGAGGPGLRACWRRGTRRCPRT